MIKEHQRLHSTVRDVSPCKDCTERFKACWDRCPKDARGEYGYKAWKAEAELVKAERLKYMRLTFRKYHWHSDK